MDISLEQAIDISKNYCKKHNIEKLLQEKTEHSQQNDFWDTPHIAQKIMQEKNRLETLMHTWKTIYTEYETLQELHSLLSEEEYQTEQEKLLSKAQKELTHLFLSGEYDFHEAIIHISVGAGGVDAADWTDMLARMYLSFAQLQGWRTKIYDRQEAEIAGIKGITFSVEGNGAIFGLLSRENGSHRMIRKSPFNAGNSRETSFAFVEVVPKIEHTTHIDIDEKDLKIDTFRASGAGGQHVNTTDSAVRITHLPTGIVTQCQNERSQHQNKAQAMILLEARLSEKLRKEQEAKDKGFKQEKTHTSFGGGHIRSYVLDDQYIKDTRNGYKTSRIDAVLSGYILPLLEAQIIFENTV